MKHAVAASEATVRTWFHAVHTRDPQRRIAC
jgi:hypothetical protein